MKHFYVHQNIGKARYVLNIHTDKRHTDGSLFYDVEILKSRKKLNKTKRNKV
jgi:hypothetical protein